MVSVWILPLSVIGLVISIYLYYKKTKKERLVCLMGEDCNKVVRSKYADMLGFPNEILGIIYYALLVILAFLVYRGMELIGSVSLSTVLLVLAAIASLGYLGLIYIQFFKIKEWCGYCMASAVITFIILGLEWFGR